MNGDREQDLTGFGEIIADLRDRLRTGDAARDELLAQQMATAEVLKAIGRSKVDLGSVMDTIARSAALICKADFSALSLCEGDVLISRGAFHPDLKLAEFVRQTPIPIDDQSFIGRAVLTGTPAQVPDFASATNTNLRTFRQALGFEAILFVPLVQEGHGIGCFSLARNTAGAFSQRTIDLVNSFADQAVVAIENARLFEQVQDRTRALEASLTDLREAQQRLVQTEKLAALGQLTAGIAHEINGPVGTSLTIASTLGERCDAFAAEQAAGPLRRSQLDTFTGDAHAAAKHLVANLQRAGELVQSFKEIAVDHSIAERSNFDLRDATTQLLTTLRSDVMRLDLAVAIDIPESLTMNSYPGPYGRLLTNLFANALAHGFEGRRSGRIAVSARQPSSDQVEITFSDDGQGMSDAVRHRAFDPFFRANRSRGGAGLGLHIVHNIVTQRLGGRISLASDVGKGTTCTMLLPVVSPG